MSTESFLSFFINVLSSDVKQNSDDIIMRKSSINLHILELKLLRVFSLVTLNTFIQRIEDYVSALD